ncbi:helix-turn-helix domain-containing protein [Hyphomonas sp. WL0036]|uniref:helix-turn-helix domain-containing protein n=1 Tax=Hyphomonas sediminis TaxID=2866160 RepID=UPI001C80FD3E|nr:helix-turn-helix domain-containing protein [Hyphomonas sediminis]MBY9065421.1 helix-turn-helix domain-containing protein [Hyphomonas sediminis]
MAQHITPEPVEDGQKSEAAVTENGTERSNVTPFPARTGREGEGREGRLRAEEIFRTSEYEGEALRMGQVLRRVREVLGLQLIEIAKETRIRENFLMGIERMEVQNIAPGYLKAYLLTYARYLGLPETEVVQRYTRECGGLDEVKAAAPVPKMGQLQKPATNWPLVAVTGALLAAIAAAAVTYFVMNQDPAEEVMSEAPVAVSGARDSLFEDVRTEAAKPADLPLEIVTVRQGWLEVRGADGTIFLSRTMAEGETYFPRLNAGWTVSARNGGDFQWRVGDVVIGPVGPDGAQVFSMSVDEQLVRAAEAITPVVAANGPGGATP